MKDGKPYIVRKWDYSDLDATLDEMRVEITNDIRDMKLAVDAKNKEQTIITACSALIRIGRFYQARMQEGDGPLARGVQFALELANVGRWLQASETLHKIET